MAQPADSYSMVTREVTVSGLSDGAHRLYTYLDLASGDQHFDLRGRNAIGRALGKSGRWVTRNAKELEKAGLITTEREGAKVIQYLPHNSRRKSQGERTLDLPEITVLAEWKKRDARSDYEKEAGVDTAPSASCGENSPFNVGTIRPLASEDCEDISHPQSSSLVLEEEFLSRRESRSRGVLKNKEVDVCESESTSDNRELCLSLVERQLPRNKWHDALCERCGLLHKRYRADITLGKNQHHLVCYPPASKADLLAASRR